MGDKSPKSNQKQASQKQVKTDQKNSKKQKQTDAEQAAKVRAAALKKM
jgi:hypothetical protein